MTALPLAGKKIGVVVESQFIPRELALYQERFAAYGAEVHLLSRLWKQASQRFYSTVEPGVQDEVEWITVTRDFDEVDVDDYAAIVVVANYASVRLRWSERTDLTASNAAEVVRDVPAVRFLRRAMENTNIIKGLPCHALWLLTPMPEVLAGRKVLCNKVVLADVLLAGAVYTPCPPGTDSTKEVCVDGDLVTNTGWHATEELIDRIRDAILRVDPQNTDAVAVRSRPSDRRILILLSEWGYWGEELVAPIEEFERAGYALDFCTPTGRRPNAIPVSMNPAFLDAPLQRPVTTRAMAERVRAYDDPQTEQGKLLAHPINLAEWFPQRPYYAAPVFVRLLEAYHRNLLRAKERLRAYDALLIVGGSGPIVDLCNNSRVHDLILAFVEADKLIGAECYGVACLAFARDLNLRRSILWGKHVTGHCLEYDYLDGTGFVKARNEMLDFNMGPPPYPLEYILRDATGPDGAYHGNFGHPTSVLVDYPFVTGRSTADSRLTAEKMIAVLDGQPPLRRWGW